MSDSNAMKIGAFLICALVALKRVSQAQLDRTKDDRGEHLSVKLQF